MVAINSAVNLLQYAANYSFIVGRPQGLPKELVDLIVNSPGGVLTVQVTELTGVVTSKSEKFALTLFNIVANNTTYNVMLPVGAFLADGYVTVSIGYIDNDQAKPVLRLVNITKNGSILPASSITDDMVAQAIGIAKLKPYVKA